jgi:hypothetical protein
MGIAELAKPRCHLFHLFYQVQIRLGSPPALLLFSLFFAAKYQSSLHLVRSPGPAIEAVPKVH